MMEPFKEYIKAVHRLGGKVSKMEEPSPAFPGRMNVVIEANSFEACQTAVQFVMEESGNATFTIPTKAANGSYLAIGHYTKVDCPETNMEDRHGFKA